MFPLSKIQLKLLGLGLIAVLAIFIYLKYGNLSSTSSSASVKELNKEIGKSISTEHTEVTEKPDGSKITKTDKVVVEEKQSTDKKESRANVQAPSSSQSHFKVGAYVEIDPIQSLKDLKVKPSYGVSGSWRVNGPIWLDGGVNLDTRKTHLGLSLEF